MSQWQNPGTSEMHVFVSDDVWFDSSRFLTGRPIRVFVDRNDPYRYQVDLSFLPKLAD